MTLPGLWVPGKASAKFDVSSAMSGYRHTTMMSRRGLLAGGTGLVLSACGAAAARQSRGLILQTATGQVRPQPSPARLLRPFRSVTLTKVPTLAIPTPTRPAFYVDNILASPPPTAVALIIDDGPDPRYTPKFSPSSPPTGCMPPSPSLASTPTATRICSST